MHKTPNRPRAEAPEAITNPDWSGIMDAALTLEGSTGDTYRRLYNYSMGNIAFLMYQGVLPQPVATYDRWKSVGRHVKRGASAAYILRPITVNLKDELDDDGQPKTVQRFKPVKSVFPISMTEGEPLPELEHPAWDKARALGELAITQVPYQSYDGNAQGYSFEHSFAVNPVAMYPDKTMMHELSHIVAGHTEQATAEEPVAHRGLVEFEAEGSAHLVMNELDLLTPDMATVSRGYIQGWLKGERPSDRSIRKTFTTADRIIRAGEAQGGEE